MIHVATVGIDGRGRRAAGGVGTPMVMAPISSSTRGAAVMARIGIPESSP